MKIHAPCTSPAWIVSCQDLFIHTRPLFATRCCHRVDPDVLLQSLLETENPSCTLAERTRREQDQVANCIVFVAVPSAILVQTCCAWSRIQCKHQWGCSFQAAPQHIRHCSGFSFNGNQMLQLQLGLLMLGMKTALLKTKPMRTAMRALRCPCSTTCLDPKMVLFSWSWQCLKVSMVGHVG